MIASTQQTCTLVAYEDGTQVVRDQKDGHILAVIHPDEDAVNGQPIVAPHINVGFVLTLGAFMVCSVAFLAGYVIGKIP